MGRPFHVEIKESQEELEKLLKNARTASSKERLQILYWLKSNPGISRQDVAKLVGRDKATITRWIGKYNSDGIAGLLSVKQAPGKESIVRGANLERLKERLQDPAGFHSYGQVQEWLETELGLSIAYKTVDRLVRYKLKAKLKVPRPRSLKPNESSREHFFKKLPIAFKFLQDTFGKGKRLRYLCQDETRLGLKTIGGRLITASGVKPLGRNGSGIISTCTEWWSH